MAYAEAIGDDYKKNQLIVKLLKDIPPTSIIIPAQCTGELYNVLLKKGNLGRVEAEETTLLTLECRNTIIGVSITVPSNMLTGWLIQTALKAFGRF